MLDRKKGPVKTVAYNIRKHTIYLEYHICFNI